MHNLNNVKNPHSGNNTLYHTAIVPNILPINKKKKGPSWSGSSKGGGTEEAGLPEGGGKGQERVGSPLPGAHEESGWGQEGKATRLGSITNRVMDYFCNIYVKFPVKLSRSVCCDSEKISRNYLSFFLSELLKYFYPSSNIILVF